MFYGLQQAENARVLYIDLNAFFASVEQQANPSLRGKAIAVVSHATASGTVLASSYPAKRLGVTTGTKLWEARQRCPGLVVLQTDATKYRVAHRRFVRIVQEMFGPEVSVRSIDEVAVFLAPNWRPRARELAETFKQKLAQELGESITASVGIGPNSLLAKLATDLEKPNGLVEIRLETLPELLGTLQLTQLPGIAERSARRLLLAGIQNPLDLYNTPAEQLRQRFGIWGQYWWWRLHGFEVGSDDSPLKSMSHEHVLKYWLRTPAEGWPTVFQMADRLVHRLQRNHLQCQSLSLRLSLSNHTHLEEHRNFDSPVSSYPQLLETVKALYQQLGQSFAWPVRKICLGMYQLTPASQGLQLDFFAQQTSGAAISQAIELVRRKHGFGAIRPALNMQQLELEEQPGFGKVRDVS